MGKRIGIVGGGILGMTLALRLSRAGFDITLFEASSELGGLARPMKIGSYTWDRFLPRHPHVRHKHALFTR